MTDGLPHGVYGPEYYYGRLDNMALGYRLKRRTFEVRRAVETHLNRPPATVVDIGTADALMLGLLGGAWPDARFVGLEMNGALLRASNVPGVAKVVGDAVQLPLADGVADVVVATAVIEHLDEPGRLVAECRRVLAPGGVLVITTPDPMMERISAKIGLLKEAGHQQMFNLKGLRAVIAGAGLSVVETRKFMFSPVGFPAERMIERVFGPLGLRLVMANQIAVGRAD
jgi:SAM-dependent methyltransferase